MVRTAAYQTSVEGPVAAAPDASPQNTTAPPPEVSSLPGAAPLPNMPGGQGLPSQPPALPPALPPADPLSRPESAPLPPGSDDPADARTPQKTEREAPSPFDLIVPDKVETDSKNGSPSKSRGLDDDKDPRSQELDRKKKQAAASINCESLRERLRGTSLEKIDLNSAPRYGQGLKMDPDEAEKLRAEFAAKAEERDWCDRTGKTLVRARMVELRNEQVVLDVSGTRRAIPLRDLCDVDLAYVGKSWNLPVSCGVGYEAVAGRDFVPSAVQWKASGLCHKPLYFEEPQLERYGHEIGPVLQPLVSTAHFFGNLAVLPYKMGIHPPGECQYSLGYYRPGECAPYMLPPIPYSLRGAAVQAGAVVSGAALIP